MKESIAQSRALSFDKKFSEQETYEESTGGNMPEELSPMPEEVVNAAKQADRELRSAQFAAANADREADKADSTGWDMKSANEQAARANQVLRESTVSVQTQEEVAKGYAIENLPELKAQAKAEAEATAGHEINLPENPETPQQ